MAHSMFYRMELELLLSRVAVEIACIVEMYETAVVLDIAVHYLYTLLPEERDKVVVFQGQLFNSNIAIEMDFSECKWTRLRDG